MHFSALSHMQTHFSAVHTSYSRAFARTSMHSTASNAFKRICRIQAKLVRQAHQVHFKRVPSSASSVPTRITAHQAHQRIQAHPADSASKALRASSIQRVKGISASRASSASQGINRIQKNLAQTSAFWCTPWRTLAHLAHLTKSATRNCNGATQV